MKFFKQGEFALLWPFYLDEFVSQILWFLPAFAIIYYREIGLSVFQISLLYMTMCVSMLIFEIPTGAIADIFGRKFSVLLGTAIQGFVYLSIFFITNFHYLLLVEIMLGLGKTFVSGAIEAWISDLIKKEKKDFLHGYFAKSASLFSFGLVISGFLGAILIKEFGVSVIWIVGSLSFLVSFLFRLFAKEHFVRKEVKLGKAYRAIAKQSITAIKYARNHSVLFLFLIASSMLFFAGIFSGDLAWTPLLIELNFPDYAFGYLWSAIGIVGIGAPLVSLKLMKKGKEKQFMVATTILTAIILPLVYFVKGAALAIPILVSTTFLDKARTPAERVFFHRFIKSKLRATVGSVESMLLSIVAVVTLPIAGLSVDYFGPRNTIIFSALLMIPTAIIFMKIKENSLSSKQDTKKKK